MPWTASPLPTCLADRLGLIIQALCGAIAARMAKHGDAAPLLFLAWTRLRRLAVRFEKLMADVRSGRVAAAPAAGDRVECLPQLPGLPAWPSPYRVPRGFGWLLRLAPASAAYAGQVEYLLADPEMKALAAGWPQAARMLRPLCRMLGIRPGPEFSAPRPGSPDSRADGAGPRRVKGSGGRKTNGPGRAVSSASPVGACSESGPALPPPPVAPAVALESGPGAELWPAPSPPLREPVHTGADPPPAPS